jgi:hypothetical protein
MPRKAAEDCTAERACDDMVITGLRMRRMVERNDGEDDEERTGG